MLVSDVQQSKPVVYIYVYPLFVFSHIGWEMEYSCHISKQGCHSHSNFDPPNANFWALRGTRKQNNTYDLAALRLQPLPTVSTEEKHRILAQIAEMHMKGMISMSPDSCTFPYIEKRKVPNTWFSLIHKNTFWCSDYLPFVSDFYVTWLSVPPPPPTSLEQFSQGYLRCCLLGLKS